MDDLGDPNSMRNGGRVDSGPVVWLAVQSRRGGMLVEAADSLAYLVPSEIRPVDWTDLTRLTATKCLRVLLYLTYY